MTRLGKVTSLRFPLGLRKKEIQPACHGILIHLVIPARLIKSTEPLHQTLVILRRQTVDRCLNFLNAVHNLEFNKCMELFAEPRE